MKAFLPNDIKDQNRKIIFDILLQEPQLARVEISERTTMSLVTVSKIIEHFEQIGLVKANGESREGSGGMGRKRVLYSFNPDSFMTIGIQIIGEKISAVLLNLYSEVVDQYEAPAEASFFEEEIKDIICDAVEALQKKAKKMQAHIIGMGVAVDGAINENKKTIRLRSSRNEEQDFLYEEILCSLKQYTDLPIILENDVNASAVAEFGYLDRSGQGPHDLLFISLGEGVGAGLVLDKKLHRGHNAGVGELEYMCFDTEYKSTPSSVGWLENKLSLDTLMEKFDYDYCFPERMSEQAKTESIDYIGKYIGLAISNIVGLLDMRTVILSGKTITAFPVDILEKVKEYVQNYIGWRLEMSVSAQVDSTAIGAAIISMERNLQKFLQEG